MRQLDLVGRSDMGLQPRIAALSKAIANPYLPEGPRSLANTMLKETLEQSRLPDHVKEFMVARANG